MQLQFLHLFIFIFIYSILMDKLFWRWCVGGSIVMIIIVCYIWLLLVCRLGLRSFCGLELGAFVRRLGACSSWPLILIRSPNFSQPLLMIFSSRPMVVSCAGDAWLTSIVNFFILSMLFLYHSMLFFLWMDKKKADQLLTDPL